MSNLISRAISRFRAPVSTRKQRRRGSESVLLWPYAIRPGEVPTWIRNELASYAHEGFELNSLIYSAIMYKVRSQQLAPLRVYTADVDQPEVVHPGQGDPLADMVARPNELQSWPEFQGLQTVFLNLSGNAYTLLIRDRINGPVTAMYPLRPDWVYHIPGPRSGTLSGYAYAPDGLHPENVQVMLPEDVLHVKLPHPMNPMGGAGPGLSPLAAAALPADVDNMVNVFLREFFKSGAMPVGLLSFPEELVDPDEVEEIRQVWRDRYGGAMNWLDVAVLGGGGEYKRVGMTFEEMGFDTLDERNETRILSVLGVPGILINARSGLAHATYSNAEELRRVFWEDTFRPELQLYEVEYLYYLTAPNRFVAFDFTEVPALQADMPTLVRAARELWEMGVPAHDAFRAVGISLPAIPTGNQSFHPANMIPAGQAPPQPPGLPSDEDGEEGGKAANRQPFPVSSY
jgi:HK97 family phage portal protein